MRQRLKRIQQMTDKRKDVVRHVLTYHKNLLKETKYMDNMKLLAYCHPNDRKHFAKAMYDSGEISKTEARTLIELGTSYD